MVWYGNSKTCTKPAQLSPIEKIPFKIMPNIPLKLLRRASLPLIVGLGTSIAGFVLSVIYLAANLYSDQQKFEISLISEEQQILCSSCPIEEADSFWVRVPGRLLESRDIRLTIILGLPFSETSANKTNAIYEQARSETSFRGFTIRNQFGSGTYYKLASPGQQLYGDFSISLVKGGTYVLKRPAQLVIRRFHGLAISPTYVGMMICGLLISLYAIKKRRDRHL